MGFRRIIFVLLFLATGLTGTAQGIPAPEPAVSPIVTAIESLDLEKAALLALQEPNTKLKLYYQIRIMFIRYLVNESSENLTRFLATSKSNIQALQKLPKTDPQKDVIIAEAFFLRGVAKALDKRYLSCSLDFKSACNLIDQNYRRFPANPDQLKLLGTFHVAMSAIPRKLQWLGNVLCFKGDLYTGLDMLERAYEKSALLPNEANVLLLYFYKNILDDAAYANQLARTMQQQHQESIAFNYLLLSSWLETRDNDAAIDLCEEWERRQAAAARTTTPLPIWHYTCGKAYFFKLQYQKAIGEFDRFLKHNQGRTLYADALYRKGMSLILSGRYPESRPVFHALTRADASGFDADEYASKMAAIYLLNEPGETDKILYEARNLFDGGYYDESTRLLLPLQNSEAGLSENHRTELNYRRGRIFHAQEKLEEAIAAYTAAYQTQPGRNLWMKVYACYYLGQIAEKQRRSEAATKWYKLALDYDQYPYQSGLEQRCKAGLARVKRGK